jgi:hypothetical protein
MRRGVFGEGEWHMTASHGGAVIEDTLNRADDALRELLTFA